MRIFNGVIVQAPTFAYGVGMDVTQFLLDHACAEELDQVGGGVEHAVLLPPGQVARAQALAQPLEQVVAAGLLKALDDGIGHEPLAVGQGAVELPFFRHADNEVYVVGQDHIPKEPEAFLMGQVHPLVEQVVAVGLLE